MIDDHYSLSSSSSVSVRLRTDGGNGNRDQNKSNTGQERHRALRELRSELARHQAVLTVEGEPAESGEYRELRAVLNPAAFERTADDASLRVTWIPDLSPGPEVSDRSSDRWLRTPIRAYYTLHYSESSGFDCGFHCEPNPHVDGLLHYQERSNPDEKYTYEPASFEARSLSGLLWELMAALSERLADAST
jgi:hypothetical protein